jgi:hypothetical protein
VGGGVLEVYVVWTEEPLGGLVDPEADWLSSTGYGRSRTPLGNAGLLLFAFPAVTGSAGLEDFVASVELVEFTGSAKEADPASIKLLAKNMATRERFRKSVISSPNKTNQGIRN